MPSTIGWLDQSEEQQRRMREVIALFAESGTVDDIGIGVVRDAFSDLLFPGLSTVQTRLRYFLLVPWVYQRIEAEKVPSDKAEDKARKLELDLIRSLMSSGEIEGVIGSSAGDTLKQLPSFIYWNGLRFTGIRQFTGTRADYHRAMNRINQANRRSVAGEGDETVHREASRWHHHLPGCPSDLWDTATLSLTSEEADYLQQRFTHADESSLFAALIRDPQPIGKTIVYPWDAVVPGQLSAETQRRVDHARWFSETIHGAQLLYNVMLAESARERGFTRGEEWYTRHSESLDDWVGMVDARRSAIEAVDRNEFWNGVYGTGARVSAGAHRFISGWLDFVAHRVDVTTSQTARDMIRVRERQLKKGQARLQNVRALENWLGASGAARLTYRWAEGRSGVNDIAAGLGVGDV